MCKPPLPLIPLLDIHPKDIQDKPPLSIVWFWRPCKIYQRFCYLQVANQANLRSTLSIFKICWHLIISQYAKLQRNIAKLQRNIARLQRNIAKLQRNIAKLQRNIAKCSKPFWAPLLVKTGWYQPNRHLFVQS